MTFDAGGGRLVEDQSTATGIAAMPRFLHKLLNLHRLEVLAADIQVRHRGEGPAEEGGDVLSLQGNRGTMLVDGTQKGVTGGAKLA